MGVSFDLDGCGGELGGGGLLGCKVSLAGLDCHAPILASCMDLIYIVRGGYR